MPTWFACLVYVPAAAMFLYYGISLLLYRRFLRLERKAYPILYPSTAKRYGIDEGFCRRQARRAAACWPLSLFSGEYKDARP